jgi:hypothetical protein
MAEEPGMQRSTVVEDRADRVIIFFEDVLKRVLGRLARMNPRDNPVEKVSIGIAGGLGR